MAQITPEQTTKAIHPVLGIMGGLGPAASCYLYQMITDHTPAQKDQDHIDIVISSRASTPDRTAFIVGKSKDDPFDVMEQDGISLVRYGATVLAIACNTAHYFYDRLAAALPVPVLNMPRLTAADAKAAGCHKLGILATDGTLLAETYQIACRDIGLEWAAPGEQAQKGIMSIIYDEIKQGKRVDMQLFNAAVDDLHDIVLLRLAQRAAVGNGMPFFQATATAGSGRVLGDKHRVTAHRRLLAIIDRRSGRQPLANKVCGMPINDLRSLIETILPLFPPQTEA